MRGSRHIGRTMVFASLPAWLAILRILACISAALLQVQKHATVRALSSCVSQTQPLFHKASPFRRYAHPLTFTISLLMTPNEQASWVTEKASTPTAPTSSRCLLFSSIITDNCLISVERLRVLPACVLRSRRTVIQAAQSYMRNLILHLLICYCFPE
jgi:hypothetical protein